MKGQRNLAPQSFWSMTSVDLITALTVSPFFRPISSALRRVMTLSIWLLPTRTVMWAMTSPSWMLTIFPVSWFLAERGIRRYYPNLPEILGLAFASQCLLGGHSEYASFPRSLLPVPLLIVAGLCSGQNTTAGRFIIVGMGTAPDLMTVRAQNTIACADVLLAEEGAIPTMWSNNVVQTRRRKGGLRVPAQPPEVLRRENGEPFESGPAG